MAWTSSIQNYTNAKPFTQTIFYPFVLAPVTPVSQVYICSSLSVTLPPSPSLLALGTKARAFCLANSLLSIRSSTSLHIQVEAEWLTQQPRFFIYTEQKQHLLSARALAIVHTLRPKERKRARELTDHLYHHLLLYHLQVLVRKLTSLCLKMMDYIHP